MASIGDDLRLNTMSGKIRICGSGETYEPNEIGIGSISSENGGAVDIAFNSTVAYGVNVNIVDNTLAVVAESREPVYSLDRVPPKCYVCGERYAAPGPDDQTWFRQYLHHRHKTWMPVCDDCTSPQMTLRH